MTFRTCVRPLFLAILMATAAPGLRATASEDLEAIVVTATLRALPQTEVPGSVSVLGSETLREAGQRNFSDVMALVPNLNWAGDTSLPRYFQIRGVGELQQYQGAPNPSVGFLIDDIDFSGLGAAATLFDVDRIEVLHGPQGTVYGANALAGLIYVRSAEPAPTFGGRAELDLGNYGTRTYGAVLTGPVPSLDSGFRVAAQDYRSDGFYRNAYLGGRATDARHEQTLRGRWRYQPDEVLRIDLSLLRVQINNGYDQWAIDNSRITQSDHPGIDAQTSTGASLRAGYTGWHGHEWTTIASYADTAVDYGFDGDWGNPLLWAPYTYGYTDEQLRHRSTRSLETRLGSAAGPDDGWLVGVYLFELRESLHETSTGVYLDPFDATQNSSTLNIIESAFRSRSSALYGQLDGDAGARLRWSLGLRGERHTADYADNSANRFAPTDTLWGGHASLDYALGESQHLYVLAARGYKAGGFNLSQGLPPGEVRFNPEWDLNLEVGDKLALPGGRLRLETAWFYMWRHGPQLLTGTQLVPDNPNTFVYYTGNARAGFNTGLEQSLEWQATRRLKLGGSIGLLRSLYQGFVQNGQTLPDRELPHAPSWQAALHAEWQDPRGPFGRLDVSGMDGFYYDLPPNPTRSHAYGLVGGKLGWQKPQLEVALWVRNLLDKRYTVRGFYFGDEPPDFPNKLYTQLGEPRNWGLQTTLRF